MVRGLKGRVSVTEASLRIELQLVGGYRAASQCSDNNICGWRSKTRTVRQLRRLTASELAEDSSILSTYNQLYVRCLCL